MTRPNPYTTPTLTVDTFDTLRGALLDDPLAVVDVDSLPLSHRIDPTKPISDEGLQLAIPGQSGTFEGQWRPCTPGEHIVVEAVCFGQYGTLTVESSADGETVTDALSPGNVSGQALMGARFSTSLPFYRAGLAPASPCRMRLRSQRRGS